MFAYGEPGGGFIGNLIFAEKLSPGDRIGPMETFSFTGYAGLRWVGDNFVAGSWGANETGLAGVKFVRGTDSHYAWLRLALTSDGTGPSEVNLVDWAWEDQPGTAIAAGARPSEGGLEHAGSAVTSVRIDGQAARRASLPSPPGRRWSTGT